MRPPLQISFRNGPLSESIADAIEQHAAKLGQFYDQISRCRVVIDVPHKHRQQGNAQRVHIDIAVPGAEIVVNQDTDQITLDLQVTVGKAFEQAARQLQEYVGRRRGQVKTHETGTPAWFAHWNFSGRNGG